MGLFILIKKKGAKRFLGAIPAKKGTTKVQLRKQLSKKGQLRKGYTYRIATGKQVKNLLKRITLRRVRRKK